MKQMKTNSVFNDTITLGSEHSLIIGNIPISANVENIPTITSNYGLYVPKEKLTEEFSQSIPVEENEFIEPIFRLLSAAPISQYGDVVDFSSKDVLKASLKMLEGQTVYRDHVRAIENQAGVVRKTFWQEAYTDESGVTIPAGINGILKIDAKSNPKLARGLSMDPPSVHSNSVTVTFKWRPSHHFKNPFDFYEKLGTYDDKGEMVRRIVTKIDKYHETSLVANGADIFAKKIENGKIINPPPADNVVKVHLSEKTHEKKFYTISYPNFSGTLAASAEETQQNNNINKTMEQEFSVESLFGNGLLTLENGEQVTPELAVKKLTSVIASLALKNTEVVELKKELDTLKASTSELTRMANLGTEYLKSVREETIASYKKLYEDGKEDKNIVAVLENTDTGLNTLLAFKKEYDTQLDSRFCLKCTDCGSKNISRASSLAENEETKQSENKDKSVQEIGKKLSKIKL